MARASIDIIENITSHNLPYAHASNNERPTWIRPTFGETNLAH